MRNSIKKNRNVGWMIERTRYCRRERAFAETWIKHNRRDRSNGYGWIDLIQKLFMRDTFGFSIRQRRPRLILTPRDRFIVATVMQWLGTNVGWCFLEECLAKAGFKLVEMDGRPDREYYKPWDSIQDASAWQNIMAGYEQALPKIAERMQTPRFKKRHLFRPAKDQGFQPICIRCGFMPDRYNDAESLPCLWDAESLKRRHQQWELIRPFQTREYRGSQWLFKAWRNMLDRVKGYTPEHRAAYTDRGITVCDRWLVWENFKADMGPYPGKGYSLERINNNLGYSPENCVWTTTARQARNKRSNVFVTIQGVTLCVKDMADYLGIRYRVVANRIYGAGMDPVTALTTPPSRPYYPRNAKKS